MSNAAPLERIAAALERLAPAPLHPTDFSAADAYVWETDPDCLRPVPRVNRVALPLLIGIERARDTLLKNT
ncbi:MAG: AAA family ATPase, partial [Pseudomonadota bacterium]